MNIPNWDLDYVDFPTAWWIQEQGLTHTDPRCSAAQTAAFLCDCGAVQTEWARLRAAARPQDLPPAADPAVDTDDERAAWIADDVMQERRADV